ITAPIEFIDQRDLDIFNTPVPTHFSHESASRAQSSGHILHHSTSVLHPVQRGVAKNRIELPCKRHVRSAQLNDFDSKAARGDTELPTRVESHDPAAHFRDFLREHPVTAAKIEDALPRLRR